MRVRSKPCAAFRRQRLANASRFRERLREITTRIHSMQPELLVVGLLNEQSRGAAKECSPGREPGVNVLRASSAPEGRKIQRIPLNPPPLQGWNSYRCQPRAWRSGLHSCATPGQLIHSSSRQGVYGAPRLGFSLPLWVQTFLAHWTASGSPNLPR